jgi:ABC-type branched-subunit amino acid transport system substrate-binding protein
VKVSDDRGNVHVRRALPVAVLAMMLAWGTAACGSSSSSAGTGAPSTTTPSAQTTAELLGPPAPATGTPVKVGLITNGDTCTGCTSVNEAPVARATVPWLNAHMHGLAGRPITLDVCVDDLDPGKASDCANQMIRDNVVAVVIGSNGVIETSWKILHDAKIPVITNAVTSSALLTDTSSTFMINDPIAQVVNLPIAVAKDAGAKKISTIVVDLPIATDVYKNSKSLFDESGVTLDLVPVALGTADLTPQAQQIQTNNPDGLVSIVGPDSFCIAALDSLRAVGYQGSKFMISQCLTDATRKAIPGDVLKGIVTASLAPIGDKADRSMQQYDAVLDTYAKTKIDRSDLVGLMVYQSLAALSVGAQDLKGNVTPASVTAALKGMKNELLPGSGGRHFRCNGHASAERPSVCSISVLAATLDAHGNPAKYTVENDEPIGG